jgi:hypothetical protein
MTPPRSCSAPPAWPERPTRRFGPSPAPRSISTRSWALSATLPVRPICWRSTPRSKPRAPARPVADLPWSRRKSRRSPPDRQGDRGHFLPDCRGAIGDEAGGRQCRRHCFDHG